MPVIQPIVEIAFEADPLSTAPVWSDVTRYVHIDTPIETTRGRSDELADIQPGRCSLTLDNTGGRFTPHNPGSPYYPYVKKGRHLRVRLVHVEVNYVTNPLFETSTADWSTIGATQAALALSGVHFFTGAKSCLVAWNAADGLAQGAQTTLYGLEVGSTYTANLWVYVPAGSVAVRLGVAGLGAGPASVGTNAWVRIEHTFTATDTRHALQVTPAAAPADGQQAWIDQAQVNAGPVRLLFSSTPAVISPRFDGYVNQWPVQWPGGGRVATTTLTATDLFKRAATLECKSFLEEEISRDGPAAYYPMSEPSSSTSAGNVSGGPGGSLVTVQFGIGDSGSLTFGAGRGPAEDGLSCPMFTPSDATNGKYLVADVGESVAAQIGVSGNVALECWFATADGTADRTVLAMYSLGWASRIEFWLDATTGRLVVETQSPASSGQTTSTYNTPNLADDQVHHLVYDDFTGRVWIDGVDLGTQPRIPQRRLRMLDVGGHRNQRIWKGSIGQVAVWVGETIDTAWVQRHYQAGAAGFAGESATARVQRIARYTGLSALGVFAVGTLGPVASQGPGRRSALSMIQEVAASESALVFADRAGGLTVQGRDVRYAASPAVTLSAVDCDGSPVYADDDQRLANDVRASRPGGATITLADPASQADYGRYTRTLALLKTADADTVDAASWHLARYADPAPRLESLPVDGYGLPTATYRALLDCDLSALIAVTDLPGQAPAATDEVYVEGYTEQLGRHAHRWVFTTSPAVRDQVWTLDDPVQSALDAGYRLAY